MEKIKQYKVEKQKNLPIKRRKAKLIKKLVNDYFGLDCDNGKRDKDVMLPRQISIYLIKNNIVISLREIGMLFKGDGKDFLDHASIIHNANKIKGYLEIKDKIVTNHIEKLQDKAKSISNISDKDLELHDIKESIFDCLENYSKEDLTDLLNIIKQANESKQPAPASTLVSN